MGRWNGNPNSGALLLVAHLIGLVTVVVASGDELDLALVSKARFEVRKLSLPKDIECDLFSRRVSHFVKPQPGEEPDKRGPLTRLVQLIDELPGWSTEANGLSGVQARGRALLDYIEDCASLLIKSGSFVSELSALATRAQQADQLREENESLKIQVAKLQSLNNHQAHRDGFDPNQLAHDKQSTIDELNKKIKALKSELARLRAGRQEATDVKHSNGEKKKDPKSIGDVIANLLYEPNQLEMRECRIQLSSAKKELNTRDKQLKDCQTQLDLERIGSESEMVKEMRSMLVSCQSQLSRSLNFSLNVV